MERIAEVYVNGRVRPHVGRRALQLGIYIDRVRDGKNSITVKVTNTWFNRLVYDAARPENDRKTWVLKWIKRLAQRERLVNPCRSAPRVRIRDEPSQIPMVCRLK